MATNPYLTFSSSSSFTLSVAGNAKYWNGTLEYSTNTTTWSTWTGKSAISSGVSGNENVLYMRGTGNTRITISSGDSARWVLTGSNISCSGNIENLLDYATVANGNHPTMDEYCYRNMFRDCTSLTTAPSLPATTLTNYCYQYMFYGCTSLTTPPALPATTLATGCYDSMFYGCASLTTAPSLPATTMTGSCYSNMFQSCTSLTTAPSLPATTLSDYCYGYMFYGCTSLTTAPQLPATTLANYCYTRMFYGCTSLVTAPSLPATTLVTWCYESMFYGCTSLATASSLSATSMANQANRCCYNMFYGCTSLTTAPSNLLATTLYESCYESMFEGCTSLTTAPNLSATTLAFCCCKSMFRGCTALTTAPTLPATNLANECYIYMFYGCTSLTTAPSLPATTLTGLCYYQMFYGCIALTTPPNLPTTDLTNGDSCYYGMFQGCTSLTTPPSLPATTLATYCYNNMFANCVSLTSLPELPATTLTWWYEGCYGSMFYGCTNIKLSTTQTGNYQTPYRIPSSGTGTADSTTLGDMFTNTGGTFTGTPSINTTYYLYEEPASQVEVTYNGSTIKTLTENGSFTLSTANKYMASDVVITTNGFAALTATYNGNTIINTSSDGTFTLPTANKYMTGNIVVIAASSTTVVPPVISFYNYDTALKIESLNDFEDEYEIYIDDTLINTYDKFYDFKTDGNGTLTECVGKQYYTGTITTPQTINNVAITALQDGLFNDAAASKIVISEGITTTGINLFNANTNAVNICYPSTVTGLQSLGSYPQAIVNIGLQGYIEYGWTTAIPATTASDSHYKTTATQTAINFYVKSTIVTLNNYSLYIELDKTKTINYYFDESASATITFGTNLLYVGTNKIKPTYNIYTDNASIKDTLLTYAGTNCTVNVYKRDGGSWS